MKPAKRAARAGSKRAGTTAKISISIDRSDLAVLRRRANRLHQGNVSAAIAEAARRFREEEGREALVSWLGEAGEATAAERDAIRAEWRAPSSPPLVPAKTKTRRNAR